MKITLTSLMEEERERFVEKLKEARLADRAVPVVTAELDRLLLRYNEGCTDDECRTAAGQMMTPLRAAAPFLCAIGETRVWERSGQASGAAETGGKVRRAAGFIFLIPGLVLGLAAVLLAAGISPAALVKMPVVLLLMLLSAAASFAGGFFLGAPKKQKGDAREYLTENIIDAEKVARTIRAALLLMDRNLEETEQAQARAKQKEAAAKAGSLPEAELELLSDLLEAAYSRDSEYVFDRLEEIRYYLHRYNVEVVDYTEDTARWFDRMPSRDKGTLKPALVSDGRLLKKGICGC